MNILFRKYNILAVLVMLLLVACAPPFDSRIPDTENNQFHYEHLINVKLTPDVTNLYTYGDELGIDASYYLAFECDRNTALHIVKTNNLKEDTKNGIPLSSGFNMPWWSEREIESLQRYVYQNEEGTYFKYFWYNTKNRHAYFLDFDL